MKNPSIHQKLESNQVIPSNFNIVFDKLEEAKKEVNYPEEIENIKEISETMNLLKEFNQEQGHVNFFVRS